MAWKIILITLITISMISSSRILDEDFETNASLKKILEKREQMAVYFLNQIYKEFLKSKPRIFERQTICDPNCESAKHKKSQPKAPKQNYKSSFMDTLYGK